MGQGAVAALAEGDSVKFINQVGRGGIVVDDARFQMIGCVSVITAEIDPICLCPVDTQFILQVETQRHPGKVAVAHLKSSRGVADALKGLEKRSFLRRVAGGDVIET